MAVGDSSISRNLIQIYNYKKNIILGCANPKIYQDMSDISVNKSDTNSKLKKYLMPFQHKSLLEALNQRFANNMDRHELVSWDKLQSKLEKNPEKMWSLYEMERTGGEPDVISHNKKTDDYVFYDCSIESPHGRRNVCYDRTGQESRKSTRPANNAIDMSTAMGIEILNEEQYRNLQKLGKFDTKTSSWLKTPDDIRVLGGALFADRRYEKVFVYHNSAPSYYNVRGFRGFLRI